MKKLFLIFFIILYTNPTLFAQVTNDPKINWKSAQNTYINRIEITDNYTIFDMLFYDNKPKQTFDEFIRDNPDIARKFREMGLSRKEAERIFRENYSQNQTISWEPGSKIILSNGQVFNFIKATNIPVAPQNKVVEPGQKYYFKVYFEKIPSGFESIDMNEYDQNSQGSLQYWNFRGIRINNPKQTQSKQKPRVENEVILTGDFRLYGRILDAISAAPLNAKIICTDLINGRNIDSLQTSKTGKYEFLIDKAKIEYNVLANGYSPLTESIDLSLFLKNGSLEKDIYMMPIRELTEKPKKEEPVIDSVITKAEQKVIIDEPIVEIATADSTKVVIIPEVNPEIVPEDKPDIIDDSIGEKLDKEATTFKLNKVYFNVSKADLLQESYEQLNNLADYLLAKPNLKIEIEGHTDNQGEAKANKQLSIDRAYNVRNYLVSKGVNKKRIKFTGYGSTHPVAPNDTEENRSKNRRVEYRFVE